jgi:hypothetical protein
MWSRKIITIIFPVLFIVRAILMFRELGVFHWLVCGFGSAVVLKHPSLVSGSDVMKKCVHSSYSYFLCS